MIKSEIMRVENVKIIIIIMISSAESRSRAKKWFLIAIKWDCDQSKSFICMAINECAVIIHWICNISFY